MVKGPQSALYGANTFAGAVNFVTKRPSDYYTAQWRGHVRATRASSASRSPRRWPDHQGHPGRPHLCRRGQVRRHHRQRRPRQRPAVPTLTSATTTRKAYSGALKLTPTNNLTFDGFYYTHTEKEARVSARLLHDLQGNFCRAARQLRHRPIRPIRRRHQLFCGTYNDRPHGVYVQRRGQHAPRGNPFANIEPQALLGKNDLILRFGAEWRINSGVHRPLYLRPHPQGSASEELLLLRPTTTTRCWLAGLLGTPASSSFSAAVRGRRNGQVQQPRESGWTTTTASRYKAEVGYLPLRFRRQATSSESGSVAIHRRRASRRSTRYSDSPAVFPARHDLPEQPRRDVRGRTPGSDALPIASSDDRATVAAELRVIRRPSCTSNHISCPPRGAEPSAPDARTLPTRCRV